jgi:3-phenylpropionate/trans-cinnamate dioxygenase ferredoxin reductase subunit
MILPRPQGREFLREVSVALGFMGMALLGLQTIPTSRLKFFVKHFPMDTLYQFHHSLSIFTFLILLLHPILLFINNPGTLQLLNLVTAPWRAKAAVISIILMVILVVTSVWRSVMKIRYDVWRWIHDGLAYLAIGLGLYHMFKVNYYMSLTYQKVLWLVLAGTWVAILVAIRFVRPIKMKRTPYEVVNVIEERGQSWSLILKPSGHDGLTFEAGQFAWITDESPFIFRENPFSFSTSSEVKDSSFGFTIKELGDYTARIKDYQPGDRIYVDGPYGNFSIDEHACQNLVFIAGGIGAAPVMSMLRTLADRKAENEVTFFFGNPTWESVIYREELESLKDRLNLNLVHVIERPDEDWQGEKGFINVDVLQRNLPDDYADCTYFLCGPLPMITAVEKALDELKIAPVKVHSEQYEMA